MSDGEKQDDDDLMSDFKDLFPEDGEDEVSSDDTAATDNDGSEALDELDAMLDDFEQNFDMADEDAESQAAQRSAAEVDPNSDTEDAPLLTDEVSAQDTPAEEDEARQLELDKEELDLAMSETSGDEVFDEAWGEGEKAASEEEVETPVQTTQSAAEESSGDATKPEQQGAGDDPLSEVAEIAAGSTAAAVPRPQATSDGGMSRGMVWSVIAVMLVSFGVSGFAAWLALGVSGRLDAMGGTLQGLEARLPAGGGDTASVSAMRTELRTLAARVNELAVVIEGPMSHLRESNEGALADIEQRLRKLEGEAPAASSRTLVEKKPVETKPAGKNETPAAAKGGWAINLISLRDEKDAEAELKRLRNLGVRAEKQRAEKDGKVWYRLRVPGFTSYEGAKAYIATVEKKAGVKNAWVAKD